MSEVFEGMIVPASAESLWPEHDIHARGLVLETQDLGDDLAVVYRSDPRSEGGFTQRMEEFAAEASMRAPRILLVRFDSRTGHRSAALFENGKRKQDFGETDELYVPLDEAGEPIGDAPRLRRSELDPDQEYETIENAIQLGLKALGRGKWPDLFRMITSA